MTATEIRPHEAATDPESGSDRPGRISPPWDRRRIELTVVAVALVAIAVWSIRRTEIWDLTAIFGDGRRKITDFLFGTTTRPGALPPDFDEFATLADQVVETFFMAIAGTFLAAVISFPLAFLAARNTTPHVLLRLGARGLIAFSRTVPDIIFAFIFVRAYGIGPLPGILALGFHAIGMVGKLMADAIEESDQGAREAVASQGGSWVQQMSTGVLPQVLPSFLSTILFRLDINFRSSTVLGLVGAGGVGQLFQQYTGNLRWSQAMGVVVAIMVTVLIVEALSTAARKTLLGDDTPTPSRLSRWTEAVLGRSTITRAEMEPAEPGANADAAGAGRGSSGADQGLDTIRPPFDAYRRRLAMFTATTFVLVVASYHVTGISVTDFVVGLRPEFTNPPPGELPSVWNIAIRIIPFDLDPIGLETEWWNPIVRAALFDTVAIGFAAAAIGIPIALPFAYLAARNVAPNGVVYSASRFALVVVRAIPDLIIAVILVVALGLGLIPGVIALITGVVGFGGKLFADAIEDVDRGPRDGVFAVGASRTQEALTGVTPQFMPALVGQGLYILDIMIRSSTVLGIVGAGGIGALLSNFLQSQRFEEVGGILLAIFVVVFGIERLSDWVRHRLI